MFKKPVLFGIDVVGSVTYAGLLKAVVFFDSGSDTTLTSKQFVRKVILTKGHGNKAKISLSGRK